MLNLFKKKKVVYHFCARHVLNGRDYHYDGVAEIRREIISYNDYLDFKKKLSAVLEEDFIFIKAKEITILSLSKLKG